MMKIKVGDYRFNVYGYDNLYEEKCKGLVVFIGKIKGKKQVYLFSQFKNSEDCVEIIDSVLTDTNKYLEVLILPFKDDDKMLHNYASSLVSMSFRNKEKPTGIWYSFFNLDDDNKSYLDEWIRE